MPALFSQDMQLIKKSRRMLSGIFHARPDPASARTKPRAKTRLSRRRRYKCGTSSSSSPSSSVARRTMDIFVCRGEKRKREDFDDGDDGCEDDGWEPVQCKRRLVGGGFALEVAQEDMRKHVRCDDVPCSTTFRSEDSGVEPGELPDDYQEILKRVHSSLENLTIVDADDSPPRSTNSTRQTSPEPHTTSLDCAWLQGVHDWENSYRARRCHSETSTRILSYANAVTGELPDDRGRRSAPPNLDTAWGVPSCLDRRASLGSVSARSGDGTLDGVFDESALELVLIADSEARDDVEVGREEDVDGSMGEEGEEGTWVRTDVGDEDVDAAVEEANIEAAVAAVAGAILQTTTWQGGQATALQPDHTPPEESQVADESGGQRESESEPSSEQMWESQEPVSTQTADIPSGLPSPPAESLRELTFRMKYGSMGDWGLDTTDVELEPRVCQRQVTAEDVASRIRAVKNKMMESLLDLEQRLRPHCSGARF